MPHKLLLHLTRLLHFSPPTARSHQTQVPRHAVSVKLGTAVQLQPADWLHVIVSLFLHLVLTAAILKIIKRKTKDRCVFFLSSSGNRTDIAGLLSLK
jgi:hypothetical protein